MTALSYIKFLNIFLFIYDLTILFYASVHAQVPHCFIFWSLSYTSYLIRLVSLIVLFQSLSGYTCLFFYVNFRIILSSPVGIKLQITLK